MVATELFIVEQLNFETPFLSFNIKQWNKLDLDIRNLDSHAMFREKLLTFRRPSQKSIYNIYDSQGSILLNRLRLGFSHLRQHKFQHNFVDAKNRFFYATKLCIISRSPRE